MEKVYKPKSTEKGMIKGASMFFVVALFVISFVSAATVPQDGLVAYYKFNDGSGSVLSDSVGGSDGTLTNGPTWSTGIEGGALQFDGVDDYVSLPDDLGYRDSGFSVFIWYKTLSTGSWEIMLGGNEWEVSKSSVDTLLTKLVPVSGGQIVNSNYGSSGINLADGSWHLLGFTYDGSTMITYFEGIENATTSVPEEVITVFPGRTIGNKNGAAFAEGLIDELTVYDRVLTPTEVTELFEAQGDSGTGAVCNNGVVEGEEQCDMSANCGSDCNCIPGLIPFEGACFYNYCNNGVVEDWEECDDGNSINGDGCSNDCTIEETIICIDTDGGNFSYVAGTNTGMYMSDNGPVWWNGFPERCSWDSNGVKKLLLEGYCEGEELKFEEIICKDFCNEGACIDNLDPVCIDSEPLPDYEFKGSASVCDEFGVCETFTDVCLDGITLAENFCIGETNWIWEYDCPGGCENGICADDNFSPWSCSLNPMRCPLEGVQLQTCERTKFSDGSIESRLQEVECTPGVCSGCVVSNLLTDECLDFGTRIFDGTYCALDGSIKTQQVASSTEVVSCGNDYECSSNVCATGECFDLKAAIESFGLFKESFSNLVCTITSSDNMGGVLKYDASYESCMMDRFVQGGSKTDGSL